MFYILTMRGKAFCTDYTHHDHCSIPLRIHPLSLSISPILRPSSSSSTYTNSRSLMPCLTPLSEHPVLPSLHLNSYISLTPLTHIPTPHPHKSPPSLLIYIFLTDILENLIHSHTPTLSLPPRRHPTHIPPHTRLLQASPHSWGCSVCTTQPRVPHLIPSPVPRPSRTGLHTPVSLYT